MMHARLTLDELATRYHAALPQRIRDYLNGRGIPDYLIDRHRLGWHEGRITIPIRDRDGRTTFFKLAKDPSNKNEAPKMLATPGSHAELYGWEHLRAAPQQVVICEGEFDRLVLEAQGFPAVTSTGGASVFRREWADDLMRVPEVYVCYDQDDAGREGALKVARLIPPARIVELPDEVSDAGDITDYFVRWRHSAKDFRELLRQAYLPAPATQRSSVIPAAHRLGGEIAQLKGRIAIEQVIGRYVQLTANGRTYTGRCPFHDDRMPSFVVYPETKSFFCFGCRAHGDVISFLMQAEQRSFTDALEEVRRLAA